MITTLSTYIKEKNKKEIIKKIVPQSSKKPAKNPGKKREIKK